MSSNIQSAPLLLVGYALVSTPEQLKTTPQVDRIIKYAKEHAFQLVYVEKEAAPSSTLCRSGLWTVTRALICYKCPARTMPMGIDTETWLLEAVQPCRCGEAKSLDGLVVADITSVSSVPRDGARFALWLARLGKHLIVTREDRCVSCCNPAVEPILNQR